MECLICKKRIIGVSFHFNEGTHCENCYQIGLANQKMNLRLKQMAEEVKQDIWRLT